MPSFDFVTYRFTIVKGGEKFNRCVEKGKFLGLPDDCLVRQPLNEIPAVSIELSSGSSCFVCGLPVSMSTISSGSFKGIFFGDSSAFRVPSSGAGALLGFRIRVPLL